ncbi:MAG: VOC family protein [Deltaproteobacteria bacterium]|nr:VOC family protein [Deltaproteobacteria bacterium]
MAPIDAITGYTHVNIIVTDLEAAHDFYINKLGFSVLPRPDFGGFPGAWYRIGNMQLHLVVAEEMPDPKGSMPHIAFHIPADRFDATIDALKSDGVEFMIDTMSREDLGVPVKAAFCRDPSGNAIEFTDVAPFSD